VWRLAVGRRLFAVAQAIVADHRGDTQVVVVENSASSSSLRQSVWLERPPLRNRGFVSKKRKREHFARLVEALEPLDRDKAVDSLEQRLEAGRDIEILLPAPFCGPYFENDCDHGWPWHRSAIFLGASNDFEIGLEIETGAGICLRSQRALRRRRRLAHRRFVHRCGDGRWRRRLTVDACERHASERNGKQDGFSDTVHGVSQD